MQTVVIFIFLFISVLILVASKANFLIWWMFGLAGYLWYRFWCLENEVKDLRERLTEQADIPLQQAPQVPIAPAGTPPDSISARTPTAARVEQPTVPPLATSDAPEAASSAIDVSLEMQEEQYLEIPITFPDQEVFEPSMGAVLPKATEPIRIVTPARIATPAKVAEPVQASPPPKASVPLEPLPPPQPSALGLLILKAFSAAKDWLLGGNTAVRVGLVIFFIGLAWLLRYTSELYEPPVELRYIGVSIVAIILLGLGWRLRLKKSAYALMLQGGGIAVLYLTTFAAIRLHALIPPEGAFVIMVSLTAAAVALAVIQNAMGLACAAVLGGFASPILVSTGEGNHVTLFSYFALLNTGIALIAWFKAWRVLNLIGFIGTFSIGIVWGLRSYTPEKFASTEPFLILFLLMFVLIGQLFARRKLMAQAEENGKFSIFPWSETHTDYLDGTLAFGPPLIGFGLQCAVISHIEYGMAFSALALGLLYVGLALCLRGRPAVRLMTQVYCVLGVVFGTLAIPLAFDAQWTSAAWALEGAGVYWIGHVQRRLLARASSLTLILVASVLYLKEITLNLSSFDPLLIGSSFGAALLGVAYLSCYFVRRYVSTKATETWEQVSNEITESRKQYLNSALGSIGLVFLYLIAPLVFDRDGVVIAWALAGMATLFAGVRLVSRIFITCAFAIQVLAGVLFLTSLRFGQDYSLLSGWQGVVRTVFVGAVLTTSALLTRGNAWKDKDLTGLSAVPLWAGLCFINLAFLFMLDWGQVGMAWAASGLLILWLGLWSRIRVVMYFGMILEAAAGFSFFSNHSARLVPSNEWVAAVLALAAIAGAWRLHHAISHPTQNHQNSPSPLEPSQMSRLSNLLLIWGIGWWVWCVVDRVAFYMVVEKTGLSAVYVTTAYPILLVLSISATLWSALAYAVKWRSLALASLLPMAAAAVVLARYGLLLHWVGGVTWVMFFLTHLFTLRMLTGLLSGNVQRIAHVLGVWFGILVLMLAVTQNVDQFMPNARGSAWHWLSWALVPSLYLWLSARDKARFWPIAVFAREYCFYAALPVMAVMMFWCWIANLASSGACVPLPYVPLVNPLEVGLLLVLFACWRWCLFWMPEAGAHQEVSRKAVQIVSCVSFASIATLAVCRAAHAWADVPFDLQSMTRSMGVQAGWSIVWTLIALILMIRGSLRNNRALWLVGAVLTGVVVLKLFFVELRYHDGLARIISFIVVGVLLLIVGYFAPMPSKKARETEQKQESV